MPVELINPDGLPKPEPYVQVGVAAGSRFVYVSGQVARTADGEPVGTGDLAAPPGPATRRCLLLPQLRRATAAPPRSGDSSARWPTNGRLLKVRC